MIDANKILSEVEHEWQGEKTPLTSGGYRNVYIFKGFIIKEVFKNLKRTTKNPNEYEYELYNFFLRFIPKEFERNFAKIYGIFKKGENIISVNELIQDFDNTPSKTIENFKEEFSENFWEEFENIINFFVDKDILYTDMNPRNILVKRLSDNVQIPVFIDYKTLGNLLYKWQFTLKFQWGRKRKLLRRFKRLQDNFGRVNKSKISMNKEVVGNEFGRS